MPVCPSQHNTGGISGHISISIKIGRASFWSRTCQMIGIHFSFTGMGTLCLDMYLTMNYIPFIELMQISCIYLYLYLM